jgi:hypothetical protein
MRQSRMAALAARLLPLSCCPGKPPRPRHAMWQSQITTGRAARSDVTYLELLHWEAAVDVRPEELAKPAGDRFRG